MVLILCLLVAYRKTFTLNATLVADSLRFDLGPPAGNVSPQRFKPRFQDNDNARCCCVFTLHTSRSHTPVHASSFPLQCFTHLSRYSVFFCSLLSFRKREKKRSHGVQSQCWTHTQARTRFDDEMNSNSLQRVWSVSVSPCEQSTLYAIKILREARSWSIVRKRKISLTLSLTHTAETCHRPGNLCSTKLRGTKKQTRKTGVKKL